MKFLKGAVVFVLLLFFIGVTVNEVSQVKKFQDPMKIEEIDYDCESKNYDDPNLPCSYRVMTEDFEFIRGSADSIERLCYKSDDNNVTCDIEIGTIKKNGKKKIKYLTCTDDDLSYYCGKNSAKDVDRLSDAQHLAINLCEAYLDADIREGKIHSTEFESAHDSCKDQRYLTENGFMEEEEYDQIIDTGQEVR